MSMQQVNLYQDELKTQKLKYSALILLKISIVLLVLLSATAGFSYFQLQQHKSSFAEHQQQQKIALTDLQTIQSALSLRIKDAALARKIIQKTKELSNKQKVLNILSQDEFGNTKGFIEHVGGLARQRIEGLWLTKIRIASGGNDISLNGTTSSPSLLPKYLQRLSSEKAFSGTQFQSLLMARQEKKKQWLNFSLKNQKVDVVNP